MKKTLLFAVVALSINAFAQNNRPTSGINSDRIPGQTLKSQTPNQGSLIQIFDSVYLWKLDSLNNGWNIYLRTIKMAYDINNNLTSCITQSSNGSAWINYYHYTYTYDAHHNQTSKLYQEWNGSAWVNMFQYFYTYDTHNNQTSEIDQSWNGSNWINVDQYIYTYNVNNDLTGESYKQWNGSDWVNYWESSYTYDANNNQTRELTQRWSNSTWVNMSQNISTYNADNKLTNGLYQTWNGSVWENYTLSTYTYDASNNLTNKFEQSWNGTAWVNYYQYTYTYDTNNNQASELSQFWWDNAWANSWHKFSSYDANNFIRSIVNINWNVTGLEVTGGDSTYYYFHTVLGINDLKLQDGGITVYPNPTTGKFTIKSKSNLSSIEIYDLLGEQIYSDLKINGRTSTKIDLTNHCKGIYILTIRSGAKIYNFKIVVR
jgi:hypothetical protein